MKNLVLAAAAVVAIGTGTALADSRVNAQPVQAKQVTQPNEQAFANDSRSSVWVYPAFRGDSFADGGER